MDLGWGRCVSACASLTGGVENGGGCVCVCVRREKGNRSISKTALKRLSLRKMRKPGAGVVGLRALVELAAGRSWVRWAEVISAHWRPPSVTPARQGYLLIQRHVLTPSCKPGSKLEPVT